MPYTTQAEIELIWSPEAADARADDETEGLDPSVQEAATVSVWEGIIQEATDTVDMYLAPIYAQASLAASTLVRRWASIVGAYLLSQRRGNPAQYVDSYERVIALLERIQSGELSLPRMAKSQEMLPAVSNLRIDDRFRIQKTRVQRSISTGKSSANQKFSPDVVIEPYP